MSPDIKIPGPDHPITVTPSADHVVGQGVDPSSFMLQPNEINPP